MKQDRLREILDRFEQARIIVVGDAYLDEYVFGAVTGVSLEAPIPIYEVERKRHNPGAAGNAACNIAALGAKTFMIAYVGADANADILRKEFAVRNVDPSGLVVHPKRPTNTYGKLVAGGFNIPEQEVLRVDTPMPGLIEPGIEDQIIANIEARASEADAIVVVDQVSSVVTERVIEAVVKIAGAHGLLTVGDSRERAGALKGFDILVPNDREAVKGAGLKIAAENEVTGAELREAGERLLQICGRALITRGAHGISVFSRGEEPVEVPIAVEVSDVVDVTGAGDTVTATVAVSTVAGALPAEAAYFGNAAAGVAVQQQGVVTVPKAELDHALFASGGPAKVKTRPELEKTLARLREEGKRAVWTNGCFDILHAGHITYLQRAASEGDVLVVGLNSDASVQSLKGPSRPVVPEAERALLLSALECVDYVLIFDEESPANLLRQLQPAVYAKGGDYELDTINQEERHIVEEYGGRIALIPGVQGHSTTNLIARIKR